MPTPGKGDRQLTTFTREHVQVDVYAQPGAKNARAVVTSRRDTTVLVEFTVEKALGKTNLYTVDVYPNETLGSDGHIVVDTGGMAIPRCTIIRVDNLPIEEASGYVRLAEATQGRVSVTLYRAQPGGNRVYAVLVNNDDRPAEVVWTASGLIDGPPLTFTTVLDPKAILGRDGRITLPYKPVLNPQWRTKVTLDISKVTWGRR